MSVVNEFKLLEMDVIPVSYKPFLFVYVVRRTVLNKKLETNLTINLISRKQ